MKQFYSKATNVKRNTEKSNIISIKTKNRGTPKSSPVNFKCKSYQRLTYFIDNTSSPAPVEAVFPVLGVTPPSGRIERSPAGNTLK